MLNTGTKTKKKPKVAESESNFAATSVRMGEGQRRSETMRNQPSLACCYVTKNIDFTKRYPEIPEYLSPNPGSKTLHIQLSTVGYVRLHHRKFTQWPNCH